MILATWNPGYFVNLTRPNSAALKLCFTFDKARVYCAPASGFGGSTDAETGIGFHQPHEVPTCTSHFRIECGGCCIFDRHPGLAELLLYKAQSTGQQAFLTQKDRMSFHASRFSATANLTEISLGVVMDGRAEGSLLPQFELERIWRTVSPLNSLLP
jgi:hypothetical protein